MNGMIRPVAESYRFSSFIMNLVTGDLDEADARRRARGSEGASISWVLGHLLHYRYLTLALLGAAESGSPYEERFGGEATDGSDYPSLPQLLLDWNETHEALEGVFADVTDEQLLAALGNDGAPHGEKRVLDTLIFYMWHESYHMGQLGTLRKQLGYPSTAELAVAASEAETASA